LVAFKQDLEKLERTKIPDNLEIEAKPVVAIIGAGAGKYFTNNRVILYIFCIILGGFTCADMLRQNGFRGRILLITREGTLPYDRVSYLPYKSNKVKRI